MNSTGKRLSWVDALNIAACAGVLLLHCTNGEVHSFSGAPSADWFIGLFTHSAVLWPVDVFFMLSGFTLLRPSIMDGWAQGQLGGVKRFYRRRLSRLLVPVLAWDVAYMLLFIAKSRIQGEALPPPSEMVRMLFLLEYNGFMWFFRPLLVIYASMPFLAAMVSAAPRRLLRLFLLMGLAVAWLPPLDDGGEPLAQMSVLGTRYIYFVVAGYYLGHYGLSALTRRWLYAAAAASVAVMFIGTAVLTLRAPEHYRYFISYTGVPCTLTALAVFCLFRNAPWDAWLFRLRAPSGLLAGWSGLSLGVYLVQMVWFMALNFAGVCRDHILLRFALMYPLCLATTWVMGRVPLVKKMVGR